MQNMDEVTQQDQFKKGRRKKGEVEMLADQAASVATPEVPAEPTADPSAEQVPADLMPADAPIDEVTPEMADVPTEGVEELPQGEQLSPEDAHKEAAWAGRLRKREEELVAREAMLNQREEDLAQREQNLIINEAVQTKQSEGKMPSEKTMDVNGETDDGTEPLNRFSEDFGDEFVADLKAAVAALARNEVASAIDSAKHEVSEQLNGIVSAMSGAINSLHGDFVRTNHEDVDDIIASEDFKKWPEELDEEERSGVIETINGGSPYQVIKLLSKYKDRTKANPRKDMVDEAALAAAAGVRSINSSPNVGGNTDGDPMSAFLRGRRKSI